MQKNCQLRENVKHSISQVDLEIEDELHEIGDGRIVKQFVAKWGNRT
jgi:hypothetical protein